MRLVPTTARSIAASAGFAIAVVACTSTQNSTQSLATQPPPDSTYQCYYPYLDDFRVTGMGNFDCQFYLLEAGTKKVRPFTRYILQIRPPEDSYKGLHSKPVVQLEGITDSLGRSGIVRTLFPITPELVRFVEVIGHGPYSGGDRALNPIDGHGGRDLLYHYSSCEARFMGISDEQGYTPEFKAEKSCEYEVVFAACRGHTCTIEDARKLVAAHPTSQVQIVGL